MLDLKPIGNVVAAATAPPGPGAGPPATTVRTPLTPAPPGASNDPGATVMKPPAATPPGKAKKDDLPRRVAARQPHAPRRIAGVGLKGQEVNAAIDRGGQFLWQHERKELEKPRHTFTPEDIFTLLALVHADVHKKEPACDAVIRRALAETKPQSLGTYGAGVYCMLAESYGDIGYLPKVRHAARYLVEAQGPMGTWGYSASVDPKLFAAPAEDPNQVLKVAGGLPLDGPGSSQEQWTRLMPWEKGRDGDNSCTQYALLGLHSASRMGIKLPPELWKRADAGLRKRQVVADGGWSYQSESGSYGSMVCAGISSLTLCRHHLGEKAPGVDEAIERGLGWLDAHFSVKENPTYGDRWALYYLYGLERVGRILDTEFVGDHEWYPFGARHLVDRQNEDGSWPGAGEESKPELATGFALMFLTRATPSLEIAKKSGPGTLRTEIIPMKGQRVYIILDCSGTMMEQTDGVERARTAKEAMARLVPNCRTGPKSRCGPSGTERWRRQRRRTKTPSWSSR